MRLKNTRECAASGVKILVYGQAGAGKTTLIASLESPVVISAEAGLLSLSGVDVPYIEIGSMTELSEAYEWVRSSDEARQFGCICLDSISEIAEVCLGAEKATAKDPRQAYGAMQDAMAGIVRSFRDLPSRDVYFSAKLDKSADEMGAVSYAPGVPGNKTGQSLPYFFDEVLALRFAGTPESPQRALMCHGDGRWLAKDRSGRLDAWEPPDLGAVIRKIRGQG